MLKTYNEIYLTARNILRAGNIEGYALEAKILVAAAAGKTTGQLLRDMSLYSSDEVAKRIASFLERRLKGEPVAYITNSWEFYGLPMYVTRDVLIPRIDTEILVDAAKSLMLGKMMDAKIIDLCCGSGCIACAIGHEFPSSKIMAVDISASALQVCRKNIMDNKLQNHVFCMQADATAAPPVSLNNFNIIVSNPPYIASKEVLTLDSSVKDYEPLWALDGGKDGLKFYKSILKYWTQALKPGGYLLFEVGENQALSVADLMTAHGFTQIRTKYDTLGIERVVYGRFGN